MTNLPNLGGGGEDTTSCETSFDLLGPEIRKIAKLTNLAVLEGWRISAVLGFPRSLPHLVVLQF